jgi:hypothetical protein
MIPIIVGSPGVYRREEDISQQDIPVTTSIAVSVFAARRGSIRPKLKSTFTAHRAEYGLPDNSWSFGNICAENYFSNSAGTSGPGISPPALWELRVVSPDARFASAQVFNLGMGSFGDVANEIAGLISSAPIGTANGYYNNNGRQIFAIKFAQTLNTGAVITGSVTYGATVVPFTSTTFATNATATMLAIVANINSALATIPPVGSNSIGMAALLNNDPTTNTILLYGPEGVTISVIASLTGQAGNTVTANTVNKLYDIFADNPGVWANDIGTNITNIDAGNFQRTQLNFSGPLVTLNSVAISFYVNNNLVVIPPTVFATNNDTTLAALATAIQTAITGAVATVIVPLGSAGVNARQIIITAPKAGPAIILLNSAIVTLGAAQPLISFVETFAGVLPDNTFVLNVWQRGNIATPIASYKASLTKKLDGFNKQLYIEEKVNFGAGASSIIRVAVNPIAIAGGAGIDSAFATTFANVVWLQGGNDGSLPTNSALIAAWDTFSDTETYRFNILINAGYTDPSVQQKIAAIAKNRADSIAIIDMASNAQDVAGAILNRTTVMNIDSSYAAIYSSDLQILDGTTDSKIYVPPSGYAASRYVYTDNNQGVHWAPAGNDRGQLPGVIGVRQIYKKPDRDLLDAKQINCIRFANDGSGYVIWGDNTAQVAPSLLSAINVRRLMLYIENTVADSLERNVFDNPTPQLLFLIQRRITRFLDIQVAAGAAKKYLVLADNSNNPPYFNDIGQLNISTYIIPIRAAKTILLDTIVTPSTVSFQEILINGIF